VGAKQGRGRGRQESLRLERQKVRSTVCPGEPSISPYLSRPMQTSVRLPPPGGWCRPPCARCPLLPSQHPSPRLLVQDGGGWACQQEHVQTMGFGQDFASSDRESKSVPGSAAASWCQHYGSGPTCCTGVQA